MVGHHQSGALGLMSVSFFLFPPFFACIGALFIGLSWLVTTLTGSALDLSDFARVKKHVCFIASGQKRATLTVGTAWRKDSIGISRHDMNSTLASASASAYQHDHEFSISDNVHCGISGNVANIACTIILLVLSIVFVQLNISSSDMNFFLQASNLHSWQMPLANFGPIRNQVDRVEPTAVIPR